MNQYHELCERILETGIKKEDRTGTGTLSIFGHQMRFDLSEGFPLLTTKHVPFRLVAEELFWFLSGDTDASTLAKKNVHIWTPDAYRWYKEHGGTLEFEAFKDALSDEGFAAVHADLGPIYGKQWRSWNVASHDLLKVVNGEFEVIDQIQEVIHQIKTNPDSRRMLVSAWNPGDLKWMALPPCHYAFQFYVADGKLSCMFQMRSTDVFLGLPFNIASYALLTHLIAKECKLEVGELIYTGGDAHIYLNHIDQVKELLSREPRPLPTLEIEPRPTLFCYRWEDLTLVNYDPHPAIKGKVSVG